MNKLKTWKVSICYLICGSLFIQSLMFYTYPTKAHAEQNIDLNLEVSSAILMEASTGEILYEINADKALPPASMAKMMTEYLVLESIQLGKMNWEDLVTTSENASDVIGSGQLLAQGEKLSVLKMFEAMSIYSANDASVALAEYVGGTEENFAKMMNMKAKQMGMSSQTNFINATGLSRNDMGKYMPKEVMGETMLSARDLAILARNLLNQHHEILQFTQIPSKKLRETDKTAMVNWNWMLENNKDVVNFKKYVYVGLDGLKTGHTTEAGYCFTGTAQRDGLRLISVIMGTETEPERFEETRKILDYGFNNFEIRTIIAGNVEIKSLNKVEIRKGIEMEVNLVTEEEINMIVNKDAEQNDFEQVTQIIDETKLVAPISKGDQLGTLTIRYENKEKTINLVADSDVEKAGTIRLLFRSIQTFFSMIITSIKNIF
jgi:D-alanyl-D-alanine carboxypeptidase (penicillin-binding protein 5/6)